VFLVTTYNIGVFITVKKNMSACALYRLYYSSDHRKPCTWSL